MSDKKPPFPGAGLVLLAAPLGPLGVFVLAAIGLPLLGLPALARSDEPVLSFGLWALLAGGLYAALLSSNPDLRRIPAARTIPGKVGMIAGWILLQVILFGMLGGFLSGVLLAPSVVLGVVLGLLAAPEGFPRGGYVHRVMADLLLIYAGVGAALAGRAAVWIAGAKPARWRIWLALLATVAAGGLLTAFLAGLGRFDPPRLHEMFVPPVERR